MIQKNAIAYLSDINDPVVLILDDLDDPRNIGACFRTANAVKGGYGCFI
ncbi:MAG: hypothetical protein Ct9H300mP6_13790 [Gammaproteobacteria bacterium]|nr:MAG: hypothetical protein Ct9H300mP6_13790 [Gammaproteobacteria bacterium]